uniref:DUF397 domain-containing protein n=1 Tax=Ascaris lumbricoides TaxID=6252 RepID=A0A0M3HUH0_ASCLU
MTPAQTQRPSQTTRKTPSARVANWPRWASSSSSTVISAPPATRPPAIRSSTYGLEVDSDEWANIAFTAGKNNKAA